MTAMAMALRAAGVTYNPDRLGDWALDAWAKYPGAVMGGARRDYIVERLRGEATYELVQQFQPALLAQCISQLLARTEREIRDARPVRDTAVTRLGGGHCGGENHRTFAPTAPSQNRASAEKPASGAGQKLRENHRNHARANIPGGHSESGSPIAHAPRASAAAGLGAAAAAYSRSLLETFKIDGRALGAVTPAEAREWATKGLRGAQRTHKFILELTLSLPPDDPIGRWVSPETAQQVFEKTGAAHGV